MNLPAFLLGKDTDCAYDPVYHEVVALRDRPWWWRLYFRVFLPYWRLVGWMLERDSRFRMRYFDRWPRGRHIQ